MECRVTNVAVVSAVVSMMRGTFTGGSMKYGVMKQLARCVMLSSITRFTMLYISPSSPKSEIVVELYHELLHLVTTPFPFPFPTGMSSCDGQSVSRRYICAARRIRSRTIPACICKQTQNVVPIFPFALQRSPDIRSCSFDVIWIRIFAVFMRIDIEPYR